MRPRFSSKVFWLAMPALPELLSLGFGGCSLNTEGLGPTAEGGAPGAGGAAATGGTTGSGGYAKTGGSGGGGAGGDASVDQKTDAPLPPPDASDEPIPDGPAEVGKDVTPEAPLGDENCLNGVDDNGDGLVDCADPKCQPGHVCVPAAPTGWNGVYYGHERPDADAAAACPSAMLTLHGDPKGDPAACTCSCGQAQGGQCSDITTTIHQFADCKGAKSDLGTKSCGAIPNTWTLGALSGKAPTVSKAGSCAPAVQSSISNPQWTVAVDLCPAQGVGAGCQSGSVCVPVAPAADYKNVCIDMAGDQTCPAGYDKKSTYHESIGDDRTCELGGCGCDAASNQSCTATFTYYSAASCSGTPTSWTIDGACKNTNLGAGVEASADVKVYGPSGGACSATGKGTSKGTVYGVDQHTTCCTSIP